MFVRRTTYDLMQRSMQEEIVALRKQLADARTSAEVARIDRNKENARLRSQLLTLANNAEATLSHGQTLVREIRDKVKPQVPESAWAHSRSAVSEIRRRREEMEQRQMEDLKAFVAQLERDYAGWKPKTD